MKASDSPHFRFMKAELELCFTFVDVAQTNYRIGHRKSAESARNKAEIGYATLQRFLNDPKHLRRITKSQSQQITAEMQRLRERLDSPPQPH